MVGGVARLQARILAQVGEGIEAHLSFSLSRDGVAPPSAAADLSHFGNRFLEPAQSFGGRHLQTQKSLKASSAFEIPAQSIFPGSFIPRPWRSSSHFPHDSLYPFSLLVACCTPACSRAVRACWIRHFMEAIYQRLLYRSTIDLLTSQSSRACPVCPKRLQIHRSTVKNAAKMTAAS